MELNSGLELHGIAPNLSPYGRELAAEQSGWYPKEFFLTEPCVVVDQGNIVPCCVSCAISTCVEILDRSCEQLSPLFHYYMFLSQRSLGSLQPMSLADGLGVLGADGICLYKLHPARFTAEGAKSRPSKGAKQDAIARRKPFEPDRIFEMPGFAKLSDSNRVGEWKKALLGQYPIIIGFYRTDQYSPKMQKLTGEPNMDNHHAVTILGYRESIRSFLVQDSYGSGFGINGRWWLPYDRMDGSANVVEEAYVVGRRAIY